MLHNDDHAWDECPDAESCELIHSFLELVDSMVKDIQHLKAETIRARYELSQKYDPEHTWITTVDILSADADRKFTDDMIIKLLHSATEILTAQGFIIPI